MEELKVIISGMEAGEVIPPEGDMAARNKKHTIALKDYFNSIECSDKRFLRNIANGGRFNLVIADDYDEDTKARYSRYLELKEKSN